MVTHGARGDVIVKAPVVNPRPPTTAATGPIVALEAITTVFSHPVQSPPSSAGQVLPSAACAAEVLAAASEASALSRTQQSLLTPLGAVGQGQRQPSATPRLPLDVRPASPGSVQLIRRSASPCMRREVTPRRSPASDRQIPLLPLCMADSASRAALVDLAQGAPLSQSRRAVGATHTTPRSVERSAQHNGSKDLDMPSVRQTSLDRKLVSRGQASPPVRYARVAPPNVHTRSLSPPLQPGRCITPSSGGAPPITRAASTSGVVSPALSPMSGRALSTSHSVSSVGTSASNAFFPDGSVSSSSKPPSPAWAVPFRRSSRLTKGAVDSRQ